jgi:hypothetical protein
VRRFFRCPYGHTTNGLEPLDAIDQLLDLALLFRHHKYTTLSKTNLVQQPIHGLGPLGRPEVALQMLAQRFRTGANDHTISAIFKGLKQVRNRRLPGAWEAERSQPAVAEPGLKALELAFRHAVGAVEKMDCRISSNHSTLTKTSYAGIMV